MPTLPQAAALVLAMGAGAVAFDTMSTDIPDLDVPDGPWQAGGALDGRVFHTTDTIRETGEVLQDALHFEDGRFQSAKCQLYCDFGWTRYETWQEGGVIRFTVTTTCPDAPHRVVWLGTVEGDALRFEATWTTRRWYWTRQINATGAGAGAMTPRPDTARAG